MKKFLTKKNILTTVCFAAAALLIICICVYISALNKYSDFAYKNNLSDLVSLIFHDKDKPYNNYKINVDELFNHDYSKYENCKVKSKLQIAINGKEECLEIDSLYVYVEGHQSGTVNIKLGDINRTYYVFKSQYDSEGLSYINYQGKWYSYQSQNNPPLVQDVIKNLLTYTKVYNWSTYPISVEANGIQIAGKNEKGTSSINSTIYDNETMLFKFQTSERINNTSFLSSAVKAEDKIIKAYNRSRGGISMIYEVYDVGNVLVEELTKPDNEIEYLDSVYPLFSKYEEWVYIKPINQQ